MITGLPDIRTSPIDPTVFNTVCHTWTVGPLTVAACVDLLALTAKGSVSLMGVRLGQFELDTQHTSDTIGGSVGGFKAEVTLTALFAQRTLTTDAEVCAPFIGCFDYSTGTTW